MNLKLLLLVFALAVVCLAHKSRKKISSKEVQRLSVRVSQRKCPVRLVNKLQSQIEELQKASQSSKKSSKKHRSSKKISRHVQSALNILKRCRALIAKNMLTTPVVKLTTAKIVARTTIAPPKSTKAPEKSAKPSTAAANTTTTAQKPTTTASVTTKAARQKPTTASIVTTTAAIKPTTTFTAQKPTAAQKSTTTAPKITTATQKPFTTAAAHKPTTAAAPKPTTAAAQKPTTTAPVTTTASGQKSTAPKITTAAQNATTTAAPFRPTTEAPTSTTAAALKPKTDAPTSTKAIPKTATAAPETTTTAAKSIFKRLKLGFDVACPIETPACPLNDGVTYANMNFVQFTNPFNNVSCANSSSCNVKFEICVGLNPDSCDLMTRTEIIPSQFNRGYLRNISDTQGSYSFYVAQGLYQGIYVNVTACLSSSGDCDSVLDTYSLKYNSSANCPPQNFALQGANNTRLTLEMDMLCPSVPNCSRNEILEVGIWLIRWDMFTNSVSYNLPCFPDNSFCAADVEICIGYPAVPRDCQLVHFRSEVMNDGRKIIFNKTLPHYTTYTSDLDNPIYISFNRTRGINIFITLYNIDGNPTPFTIDKFNFEMPDQVITFNNTRIMIKNGTRPADKTQLQLGITYGCKEIPIIPVTLPTTTVVTQTTPTTTPTTTTTQPTTTTTTATSTTTPFLCKFNQFSLTLVNYSNPTNDRSTISPGGCDDIPGDYCDLYFEICLGRIGLNDSCGYAGGAIISPVLAENTQLVFPIVSKTAAEIAADTTVWRNPIIVNIQEVWQSVTMLIRVWDSDPDKPTGQNPWDDVDVFFIPVQDEPIVTRKYESAKGRRQGVPPTTLGYEIFNKCLYDCDSGDSLECQQPDANTLLCRTEPWRCPKLCGLC